MAIYAVSTRLGVPLSGRKRTIAVMWGAIKIARIYWAKLDPETCTDRNKHTNIF